MAIDPKEALDIDMKKAENHCRSYIVHIQNQITQRGLMLVGAMQDFNDFRNLPPSNNLGAAIWDFAFGALSAVVPALKLGEFIAKHHERAKVALDAAKAFGQTAQRSDKVVKVVTGGAQQGGKLAQHGNTVKELVDKASKISESAKQLAGHASRGPILELVKDLNAATAMWEDANAAILQEWQNRVDDKPGKGTLFDKAKELLPDLPRSYTVSEFDEIWKLYLYLMIGKHISDNCKYIETVTDYGYGQSTTETKLDGLNDTQEGKIIDWFGYDVPRGKIFSKPPVYWFTLREFYSRFPIGTETRRRSRTGDIRAKL